MATRGEGRRAPMRRQDVAEQDTRRTVAEDAKKACARCHIMKVNMTEGREGGRARAMPTASAGSIDAIQY